MGQNYSLKTQLLQVVVSTQPAKVGFSGCILKMADKIKFSYEIRALEINLDKKFPTKVIEKFFFCCFIGKKASSIFSMKK